MRSRSGIVPIAIAIEIEKAKNYIYNAESTEITRTLTTET